jgi:phosphopantetheinyl transferase (holo-ACP synthase)
MFKKEFDEYIKTCYGHTELHPTQEKEVKQAFYAGGFASFNALIKAMESGKDSDIAEMADTVYKELAEVLKGNTHV